MSLISRYFLVAIAVLLFSFCSKTPQLAPLYEAELVTISGANRFPIYVSQDKIEPNRIQAYVVNGLDTARFTRVNFMGPNSILLSFEHYDSHILAEIQSDGSWIGTWKKRLTGGNYDPVEFTAKPTTSFTRYNLPKSTSALFEGEWQVLFTKEDGSAYPATGIFHHAENGFFGTFLTETGDYRFLEGAASDSNFILSDFDGGHAFRFSATLGQNNTIVGEFISRKSYRETFTAVRGQSQLKDAYSVTELTEPNASIEFAFPDVNGTLISHTDEQFKGKPLLVYLFGSWCPNCSDESNMLKELYETKYKNSDLAIIGIAFEYTGEFETDKEMVEIYRNRFSIPWITLIGGSSNKQSASEVLTFVKEIKAFPTSFFVDRTGKIKAIHTGFKGPGTGAYYLQEKQQFESNIESILNP